MLADQSVEAHDQALPPRREARVMTLHEIAEECRSRRTMKEDDLLQHERAVEDRLIDVRGPGRIGFIAEF